jgi:hypothetical protein
LGITAEFFSFGSAKGSSMNHRLARGFAAIAVLFAGPAAMAQVNGPDTPPRISPLVLPANPPDLPSTPLLSLAEVKPLQASSPANPPPHFSKARFVLLSVAVYGAAFADMYQTLQERKYSSWREIDPLARPLVRLPAPAYYATGLAMATGVNWVGWKMAHSRRWHKLAPIPQLLTMSGNLNGFRSNLR